MRRIAAASDAITDGDTMTSMCRILAGVADGMDERYYYFCLGAMWHASQHHHDLKLLRHTYNIHISKQPPDHEQGQAAPHQDQVLSFDSIAQIK
jgi:hypothetical protein